MAAQSFFVVGETWFQSFREGYNPEAASIFRECDARCDENGELDYFTISSRQMGDRLELLGIDINATAAAFRHGYMETPEEYRPDGFDFHSWLEDGKESVRRLGGCDFGADADWIDSSVDIRYIIRAVIEMHEADVPVVWNLADVVGRGFVSPDPRLCELELEKKRGANVATFPVIVLTEGSTDASFLSSALSLIYPHLVDFLKFMDFGVGAEGGASALARSVKSFAASGVANRVIAIFDNDTAASDVLVAMNATLPNTFRVLRYPDIDLGKKYPTIGPTGRGVADVNGKAGALELYFGEDVLKDPAGELTPVQWTGYVKRQNAYQGELLDKSRLQKSFRRKLDGAIARGSTQPEEDWSGVTAILDSIRHAFRDFSA
ncbi:hypothetical protein OG252_24580 [Streptomyces sp. NBC_01352]|uniref:hypothetical protein n=1 Tax=Streptomyces sp. NBC_01352 TaxID=2903834 RepID=UPI002E2ED755|nr:hypothetical protein [Streptomyces sp. NBC_01352]